MPLSARGVDERTVESTDQILPTAREDRPVVYRRTLRRMFLSAFESEGLDYVGGGCQVAHADLTWSMSLVVDGTGTRAPYRLILGASLPKLGDLAPRNAEECYLFLPLNHESSDGPRPGVPRMPDAAFPDWAGTEDARARAIDECVASVVRYARQVDSVDGLRARYSAGDYGGAFIIAPLRKLLEEAH
jgi:hypothetical protein